MVAGRLAERGSGFGLSPMIPAGMRAVAVKVNEVVGVAGFLIPGLRVDVLVTIVRPGKPGPGPAPILQNIVVVSAGQQIQPDSSGRAVNVPVVTLLVTPEQAEILTLAGSEGRVQLVLRNSGDQGSRRPPGAQVGELYGRARPAARGPEQRPPDLLAPEAAPAAPARWPRRPLRRNVGDPGPQASVEAIGGKQVRRRARRLNESDNRY